jgi:hypothetical protein
MKGKKVELTTQQERWLVNNFADTSNAECAEYCGCNWRTVVRKARELGLTKSREYMLAARRKGQEMAAIMNRGEGNRGKENLLRYGRQYQFRKGESNVQRLGEAKERERIRKSHEARNKTIASERVRIKWGFEQKTRLRLVRQPKQWIAYRNTMKRRGYIASRGSREIYYNEDTNRSAAVEHNATKAGLIILQADGLQYKTT